MLTSLKKQQSVFPRSRETSDAAVKASYLLAQEIALASKPFSEGEFAKTFILKAAETVCPEKRQAFANISLTRNTVADRISEVAEDLDSQLNQSHLLRFQLKSMKARTLQMLHNWRYSSAELMTL